MKVKDIVEMAKYDDADLKKQTALGAKNLYIYCAIMAVPTNPIHFSK
jgi:hypothetical protein